MDYITPDFMNLNYILYISKLKCCQPKGAWDTLPWKQHFQWMLAHTSNEETCDEEGWQKGLQW